MEEGQHYYMYSKFLEGGGGDYMKSGVEIENSGIVGHHQTMKQIQELGIKTGQIFERTILKIENPDDGEFIWTFKNPKTDKYSPTIKISANATAWTMRNATKGYFKGVKNTDIDVVRYDMDEDGNNCTCSNKTVKTAIYEITATRLFTDVTCKTSILTKFGSQSTITAFLPGEEGTTKSSPPMSGKFQIQCKNEAGQMSLSSEIPYNYSPYWIAYKMMESCHGLFNKVEGLRCASEPRYDENEICFQLRFKGVNNSPQPFAIVSAENSPLGGLNNAFSSKIIKNYGGSETDATGTNLFYSPIPFEFLKTYEEKP
jgi:hypothetical protein